MILQFYSDWLVDNGYTDTDIIFEEPKAVDAFLEEFEKEIGEKYKVILIKNYIGE